MYERTVGPWRHFILIKLFERIPAVIRSYKDYYISKHFFFSIFSAVGLFFRRSLRRLIHFVIDFILFTARYQTLVFFSNLRKLFQFLYYRMPREIGRHKRNFFKILSNVKKFYKLARPLLLFSRFLGAFVLLVSRASSADFFYLLLKLRVYFANFKTIWFMHCLVQLNFFFSVAKALALMLYFSFFFVTAGGVFFWLIVVLFF